MKDLDHNIGLASSVLKLLIEAGVREACVCPGRRNAPFVVLLEAAAQRFRQLKVYSFFDERSAAFFALGRARALRAGGRSQAVAVCTTSGTACAELLPATIEAWYSGDALVLVTSDRPRRLRGSGAPQAIEQAQLYGPYVQQCFDIERRSELPSVLRISNAPCHLNICFDEPVLSKASEEPDALSKWLENWDFANSALAEAPARYSAGAEEGKDSSAHADSTGGYASEDSRDKLARFLRSSKAPLVIVGPLPVTDLLQVEDFLLRLQAPVFAEAGSQLHSVERISHLLLRAGNTAVAQLLERGRVDAVLRIGGVPAPRVWRDLDEKFRAIPVCVLADRPFVGLGRGELLVVPIGDFLQSFVPPSSTRDQSSLEMLLASDRSQSERLGQLIEQYPCSELGLLRQLDQRIPDDALVYLGNSLPIREWDLAARVLPRKREFAVSRGANGIDGQVSTFLGLCAERGVEEGAPEVGTASVPPRERWAILGDLTALYDLSAPWALRYVGADPIRVVIMHNGGGQIFSRMFRSPEFLNTHDTSFEGWASMWGMEFRRWGGETELRPAANREVIEARPNPAQTAAFWSEYERLGL